MGASQWLQSAVEDYGVLAKAKLSGPGDREAAIRTPIEGLLGAAGSALGVPAVFHDEVRDTERQVRPDYGVSVAGAITGYVEVKAPGRSIDPAAFTGHDRRQWERQRDLPNLLYTNGTEWRLYRDSAPVGDPVVIGGGSLTGAGAALTAPESLESLLTDFLRWSPAPITSVLALVRAIAPLTRLLRGEVLDSIAAEDRAIAAGADPRSQPFTGLAKDWRALLFPNADDHTFADGYAQTVTFALLLARTEQIDLHGTSLHEVGDQLGSEHSLMGRALQLLTEAVALDFKVTLDLLVRVVGAVDWDRIRAGRRDLYLYLYENFLAEYDPVLRQASGSYYTPREVVGAMVRLTEDVLRTRLGKDAGFGDPEVLTVDPAMGTGTFLHTIIERVTEQTAASADGPGMVKPTITALVERLIGFEQQLGPYAVAELRASELARSIGAGLPASGLPFYVTDTLDNPNIAETQLSSNLWPIARARDAANKVKRRANVTVVIGNPPYRERAEGMGGWVESGDPSQKEPPPLAAFRADGNGLTEYVLKNLYVYFWRWATWKVFDSTPTELDGDSGVVCFITTSGYLRGPGFKGMREYLRRRCTEGWVIDVSPEGIRPDVATRLFPGVQQPLAIGLFVRNPDGDLDAPARIRHRAVTGRRSDKHAQLAGVDLDDDGWRDVRTAWQSPFTPAADSAWDDFPAVSDLMPWTAPGAKPNRTWVYSPARSVLQDRWRRLVAEADPAEKARLFRETPDSSLARVKEPLPPDRGPAASPFAQETVATGPVERVGYRSFDSQWVLLDPRLLDRPRPTLWAARQPGQVFAVEQHAEHITDGPGLTFTSLVPDMHHFNNRGGRTLPLLHADGSPNVSPGLLAALSEALGIDVAAADLLAYVAALTAHPGFTATFSDELSTPGVRVPLTADVDLWTRAAGLGREVVWLHTYGESFAAPSAGRPASVRYPQGDPRQPLVVASPTAMPESMTYDADTQVLRLGDGEWGPVTPAVQDYAVGGRNVLGSWFGYRKASPRRSTVEPTRRHARHGVARRVVGGAGGPADGAHPVDGARARAGNAAGCRARWTAAQPRRARTAVRGLAADRS